MQTYTQDYDVVIMGAGFAGICQARHLLLNIPGIKVALIDPRPEDRQDRDMKVGESMVELAALFVSKELGLHDYMLENHPPKQGLNFHWPKSPENTKTLDDYYHVWVNRQVPINTFHMNRAIFERDVLKMVKDMGADAYQGTVTEANLTPGNEIKTVYAKTADGKIELRARHVVDAAGRNFIIGRKKDNLLFGPENLYGVNNGSAWVRVRNVDRKIFHDGYDPQGASVISRYYATNHWFGDGHWIWMIPTTSDSMELSVGIVHHHDVIPGDKLNTSEKFYKFLEANHNLLYNVVSSGEQVDFVYWNRIAHRSKEMFSKDNWYVLGDAAFVLDGFYSYGTSTIALAVESITEIIRAQRAGETDSEEKRTIYNKFNLEYARLVNTVITHHDKQLGHASVMSWRIYFEYMWWFGLHVPMFFGKWHLDKDFAGTFVKALDKLLAQNGLFQNVYKTLGEVVAKGGNIGLMDMVRGDQLIWGYTTSKHFDDYLENSKTEPRKCNVFVGLKKAYFYIAVWYALLQWKARGFRGVLSPTSLYHGFRLLALSAHSGMGDMIYRFKNRGLPTNSGVARMREEFKTYRNIPDLTPWAVAEKKPGTIKTRKTMASDKVKELDTAIG